MIREFDDVVIQTASRLLAPFLQIFALYVIIHGHYSPGGGFQGGCIFGASFIMMVIAYDINFVKMRLTEKMNTLYCSMGVLLYAAIGLLCVMLGANYLDYGILHRILPVDPVNARALGSLGIEIGVGITVTAVMVSVFLNISSGGRHEEGKSE